MKITYLAHSLEDTKKIATLIATLIATTLATTLAKPLLAKTILLAGDVGAGKTTFTNYFINALCDKPTVVTSPTFPIVQSYDTRFGVVHHLDLYRINSTAELQNLGIDELLLDTCLIEWAEKLENYAPKHFIKITISTVDATAGATLNTNTRAFEIEFSKKYESTYKELKLNVI